MNNKMSKITAICRSLLEHRRLPLMLAVAAIFFMLPALSMGLLGDDLIQRLNQFPPAELPPRILDTGFVAEDSGQLGTVVGNLFRFLPDKDAKTRAIDYGIEPWWASEGWTAALWRPVTAFTHWVDYRLYPNSPALMHAQNIGWFALAVYLLTTLYRKIRVSAGGLASAAGETTTWKTPGICAAGLAACLWLLDWTTYGPVAYVANRGFFIALVFGLLCFHSHLQWRTGKSILWMWLSALCLLLSILSDEGGASTLAFLLAYAIVLEPGGWRPRVMSLLPAALVIIGWRAVYVGYGYGVKNWPGYIDPGYSPLTFLKVIFPRMNGLLGGQLTGLPPELPLAFNAKWQMILALAFAGVSLICAMVFWPVIRRDTVARFWAVVTLLALVPAGTVAPLSKNLGFIAVGSFGVMASFLVSFANRSERAALPALLRAISWCVAICLITAHVAGAIAGRIALGLGSPFVPKFSALACDYGHSLEIGDRDIVVINDPTILTLMVPFYRAYRGEPLPKSTRILMPGSVPFEVSRPDATTLILKAKELDLFDCPEIGPFHACYGCKSANDFLFGGLTWKADDLVTRKAFVAEILEVSPRGAPRSVAFHFPKPLESGQTVWLYFNWKQGAHRPFALPRIGETVTIAGPRGNRS